MYTSAYHRPVYQCSTQGGLYMAFLVLIINFFSLEKLILKRHHGSAEFKYLEFHYLQRNKMRCFALFSYAYVKYMKTIKGCGNFSPNNNLLNRIVLIIFKV